MSVEAALKFILKALENVDIKSLKVPLVVGISGPQGLGKSWLTVELKLALERALPEAVVVQFSMDDVYLTHEEQSKVTMVARKEGNALLQGRGLPGTHDLRLATTIFEKLKRREPVQIPRYDKSAFDGEGDRCPELQWEHVASSDIVLFEGWFNGFCSVDSIELPYLMSGPTSVVQNYPMYHIGEINQRLKAYERIWSEFDKFIYFKTNDINNVYTWREQQEHALIKERGRGMSDDQVRNFVNRYMPVYSLYYRTMCDSPVCSPGSNLQLDINLDRSLSGSSIH